MDVISKIISWYIDNKRDLPWRKTTNPYHIWISEIILQQTRIYQGIGYYNRFIKKFPDVESLANADEDEVLKLWQGLGYYSRARNLHATARIIVKNYNGNFPKEIEEIKSLKGIGQYTASAIASISYKLPYPAVDGNVYRVLSRLFGIYTQIDSTAGKKEFYELSGELIDKKNPDLYNQAMMEFGAIQCVPKSPECIKCPVNIYCFAYKNHEIPNLPVKSKKSKQKERFFNYLLIWEKDKKNMYLSRRKGNDIWKNLYELPLLESKESVDPEKMICSQPWESLFKDNPLTILSISDIKVHQLTHQKIFTRFYEIIINNGRFLNDLNFLRIKTKQFSKYAVPKLIENYLKEKLDL
jgi:A/G-specific adenine glycosylase